MTHLPEALPPVARPELGHFFGSAAEARLRAASLDLATLLTIREHLEGLYDRLTVISDHLRSPLGRNIHWRTWDATACVVDNLRRALLDADGETVGLALAQIDEEYEWRDRAERVA
jgi:hypothetical protein